MKRHTIRSCCSDVQRISVVVHLAAQLIEWSVTTVCSRTRRDGPKIRLTLSTSAWRLTAATYLARVSLGPHVASAMLPCTRKLAIVLLAATTWNCFAALCADFNQLLFVRNGCPPHSELRYLVIKFEYTNTLFLFYGCKY